MLKLINALGGLLNQSIAVAVSIALIAFFWGLVKFLFRDSGDEKSLDEGKRVMKWGIIALFVIISVWGIVRFMRDALLPGFAWGEYL